MHKRLYYCKALKHTGKPIVVYDCDTGKTTNTNNINITNCTIKMDFNNEKSNEKSRGATTILEVWKD